MLFGVVELFLCLCLVLLECFVLLLFLLKKRGRVEGFEGEGKRVTCLRLDIDACWDCFGVESMAGESVHQSLESGFFLSGRSHEISETEDQEFVFFFSVCVGECFGQMFHKGTKLLVVGADRKVLISVKIYGVERDGRRIKCSKGRSTASIDYE